MEQKLKMNQIPELLAPAGGSAQLRAAIESGADAVYMGGHKFNARINAENFSEKDLAEAVEYAHLRGVNIYIALNTLIMDGEIEEVLSYVKTLYYLGVDALIIQDFGIGNKIREVFPDLPLHLSTQGTVYNKTGVEAARDLGYARVVLAREMNLEEIGESSKINGIETEVFVHGALCISYSGQCQLSNEIGGRSANRGVCGQACRLPYSLKLKEAGVKSIKDKKMFELDFLRNNSVGDFLLSPKDLCAIDHLRELVQSNVKSLKIEGRMKSEHYVRTVTSIYRKYLDRIMEKGDWNVEAEDHQELAQIFNRGGFTESYLSRIEEDGKTKEYFKVRDELMSRETPGHNGVSVGTVSSFDKSKKIARISSGIKLNMGDVLEIRGNQRQSFKLTFLKLLETNSAHRNYEYDVGDIKAADKSGSKVFRMVDEQLVCKYNHRKERKIGAHLNFKGNKEGTVQIEVKDDDGNISVNTFEKIGEKAERTPTTEEGIRTQLMKTGDTVFELVSFKISIHKDLFISKSNLNMIRREALSSLEKLRIEKRPIERNSFKVPIVKVFEGDKKEWGTLQISKTLYLYEGKISKKLQESHDQYSRIYIPFRTLLNEDLKRRLLESEGGISLEKKLVPVIPTVTKGIDDIFIRDNLKKLIRVSRDRGISIGNLGWLQAFVKEVPVYGDFGLNLTNSESFAFGKDIGLKEGIISHEVDLNSIENMNFYGMIPEIWHKGRIPVMILENCPFVDKLCLEGICKLNNTVLLDRKNETYPLLKTGENCSITMLSYKERKPVNFTSKKLKTTGLRLREYV